MTHASVNVYRCVSSMITDIKMCTEKYIGSFTLCACKLVTCV